MGVFVIGLALAAWFFPVHGARTWYKGKAHTLRDADVVSSSLRLCRQSAAIYMIKVSFTNCCSNGTVHYDLRVRYAEKSSVI